MANDVLQSGGIGFLGNDKLGCLPQQILQQLRAEPIMRLGGVCVVVATREGQADIFAQKINKGQPICIATPYAQLASQALARYIQAPEQLRITQVSGGEERMPWLYPDTVDAAVTIEESGSTLTANKLTRCLTLIQGIELYALQRAESVTI